MNEEGESLRMALRLVEALLFSASQPLTAKELAARLPGELPIA